MKPEDETLHKERHQQLVAVVRKQYSNDGHPEYSEAMWERTLGELTAGKYDQPLGLRMFVAEILARVSYQEFIDKTAIRLCQIARGHTSKTEVDDYARVAYDQAEALWRERQKRRNSRSTEDVPF